MDVHGGAADVMTPDQLAALQAELAAHYADMMSANRYGEILAALNAPAFDAYGRVERADFAVWCGATGLRAVLEDLAATANPLRSAALAALDLVRGAVAGSIDFALDGNQQMLAAFVAQGAVTQEQADALLAMSTTKVSRAHQILGREATQADIEECQQ